MWVYGVKLSCGHDIELGSAVDEDSAKTLLHVQLPLTQNGYGRWPCSDCGPRLFKIGVKIVEPYTRKLP